MTTAMFRTSGVEFARFNGYIECNCDRRRVNSTPLIKMWVLAPSLIRHRVLDFRACILADKIAFRQDNYIVLFRVTLGMWRKASFAPFAYVPNESTPCVSNTRGAGLVSPNASRINFWQVVFLCITLFRAVFRFFAVTPSN